MTLFLADWKNQLQKLGARKKYIVFLVIQVLICLLYCLVNGLMGRMAEFESDQIFFGNVSMGLLGFFAEIYVPLVIFMAAADLFASENQDRSIRAGFMRPVGRGKQYFARALAVFTVAVVFLAVLFLLTGVLQATRGGAAGALVGAFASYALDLVPLAVLVLFAALINQFSDSPSLSIILCILLYGGLLVMGIMIPRASGLLFTGYMQWHNLWMGVLLPFKAILSKMGILAGFGMVFATLGYYLFERREV